MVVCPGISGWSGNAELKAMNEMNRVKIFNHTFYKNFPSDWSQQLRMEISEAQFDVFEVKNNIFYCPAGFSNRALMDDQGSITAHSHNLYFHPDGGTLVVSNGTRFTQETIKIMSPLH